MIVKTNEVSLTIEETFNLLYEINPCLWEQVLDSLSETIQHLYEIKTGLDNSIIDEGIQFTENSVFYCTELK